MKFDFIFWRKNRDYHKFKEESSHIPDIKEYHKLCVDRAERIMNGSKKKQPTARSLFCKATGIRYDSPVDKTEERVRELGTISQKLRTEEFDNSKLGAISHLALINERDILLKQKKESKVNRRELLYAKECAKYGKRIMNYPHDDVTKKLSDKIKKGK